MALDTPINRKSLISVFPDLANDIHFKILSNRTPVYNCIAWAMGYTDRWVDIWPIPGHWWPAGVATNMLPETLVAAFRYEGFELCGDPMPEEGYSKVVLYKKKNVEEWTHASRIVAQGIEHSKFGQEWDGEHSHNVLCNTVTGREDSSYGIAYAYMKRKATALSPSRPSGKIAVDLNKLKSLLKR